MDTNKKNKFQNLKLQIENCSIDKKQKNDDNSNSLYFKFAVNSLSRKFISEKQLNKKLKDKFGDIDFTDTIDKLKSLKFLDDQKLTEIECRNLSSRKFFSNRRIKTHLSQKGLPEYLVENFLENSDDEFKRAMNLLRKKYKTKDKSQIDKASRYLFSYGYSTDIIRKSVKEYFYEYQK